MRTTTVDGFYIENVEIIQWEGIGVEPATSTVGNSRMYFDPVTGKTRISEDGGAWTDLINALSGDDRYLKLDQTTPQSMTGKWAIKWVDPDTMQIWVNGALRMSFTTEVVS